MQKPSPPIQLDSLSNLLSAKSANSREYAFRWRVLAFENGDMGVAREMGSSERATLKMLEWTRLCSYIADFASTSVGRKSILNLEVLHNI